MLSRNFNRENRGDKISGDYISWMNNLNRIVFENAYKIGYTERCTVSCDFFSNVFLFDIKTNSGRP